MASGRQEEVSTMIQMQWHGGGVDVLEEIEEGIKDARTTSWRVEWY